MYVCLIYYEEVKEMAKNLKVRKPNVTVTQKDGMFDPTSGDVKTVTAVVIKPRMKIGRASCRERV